MCFYAKRFIYNREYIFPVASDGLAFPHNTFRKAILEKIMEPASAEYRPQLNLPKIKKQFLFSLFALIILFISFINGTSEYLKSILFIGMFFCVILVWGAFDAVYFFAEEKMKHHLRKEISDKSTNSSAANPDELSHKTTSR